MEKKDLTKLPILDMLDYVMENEEVSSILEAIRKERGGEHAYNSKTEELNSRKDILNKLSGKKSNP